MKKCAILLSGYFRRYKDLIENFNELLVNPIKSARYEVDIFFSTWNKLNSSDSCSTKNGTLGIIDNYEDFDLSHILDTYKPKRYAVGNFEENKNHFNILNYDKSLDLSTLNPGIHQNGLIFGLTQYYHRFIANELKLRHERENNFKYDIVISMRPDLFFLSPFDVTKFEAGKLYLRTFYNDAFLASTSEMDDEIARVFPNIQNIVNKYGRNKVEWFDFYCPEYWLENWYKEIGLGMEKRVELGQIFMWYWPRKDFLAVCHNNIFTDKNRQEKMTWLLDYFNRNKIPYI